MEDCSSVSHLKSVNTAFAIAAPCSHAVAWFLSPGDSTPTITPTIMVIVRPASLADIYLRSLVMVNRWSYQSEMHINGMGSSALSHTILLRHQGVSLPNLRCSNHCRYTPDPLPVAAQPCGQVRNHGYRRTWPRLSLHNTQYVSPESGAGPV